MTMRTRLTIIFLCAVLAVISSGGARRADAAMSPKQYWQKGKEYAENRLYIDAIANYTEAIRRNKGEIPMEDVAGVFNSRGLAYMGLKDHEKAIDDFSSAISIDEKNAEFRMNRADAYAREKEYDRARADLGEAIDQQPKNASLYAKRGDILLMSGDGDGAIADYTKTLELDPRNNSLWFNLGMAYREKKQYDKALQAFGKMLDVEPKHAAAAYHTAGIYSRTGKIDSACVWLDTAVENGFRDWSALKNDPDFDNIRKVDCYKRTIFGK